ncbi:mucin-7-like [Parasteatoda tepidariorum]|uniref:mucin-7-like n=1 Tax=Parasteatoda tepidariorum TaxID=114398 RepID=UPI0039BD580A
MPYHRPARGGKVSPPGRRIEVDTSELDTVSTKLDAAISNASVVFTDLSTRLNAFKNLDPNFFLEIMASRNATPSSSVEVETSTEPVPDPEPRVPTPETPAVPCITLNSEPDEEASASEPVSAECPTREPPKKRRKKKKKSKATKASTTAKPISCPLPSEALPLPETPPPAPTETTEKVPTDAAAPTRPF